MHPLPKESVSDFVTWLQQQPGDTIVGVTRSSDSCPIAQFLQTTHPDAKVSVDEVKVGGRGYSPPPWARRFVMLTDTATIIAGLANEEITASDALATLAKIFHIPSEP